MHQRCEDWRFPGLEARGQLLLQNQFSSGTCPLGDRLFEIGISQATGQTYIHLLEILERLSRE